MYYVEKIFRVPVGHRLSKHLGRCQFIHGHNLKIQVVLKSENLNTNDMVMDFTNFKQLVNDTFLDELDHCLVLNSEDELLPDEVLEKSRVIRTNKVDPTAEYLSRYLYEKLEMVLIMERIQVHSVKIWENDDSASMYMKE
jgi:6-pyruvoyltetrahydropterin/6-carboxytetrahydropterin synthase